MRLEGGLERSGRIRVAECLRQTVPNRWASARNRSEQGMEKTVKNYIKHETQLDGDIYNRHETTDLQKVCGICTLLRALRL